MKLDKQVSPWLLAGLALATAICNGPRLGQLFVAVSQRITSSGTSGSMGDYIDLPRTMVAQHAPPGTKVFLLTGTPDAGLPPVDRSLQIALAWTLMPTPVRFGPVACAGEADAVLSDAFKRRDPDWTLSGLASNAFTCVASSGGRKLWVRGRMCRRSVLDDGRSTGRTVCRPGGDGVGPFREGLGVGVVLVLLGVVCWRVRVQGLVREGTLARPEGGGVVQAGGHPPRVLRLAFLAIGVFAAGLAALALTHTFTAPNGLGVFGGKAKLLWLCHGFPPGFATDPAWATFQPAYPPGLALLTFATYVVAGGYGDWLTQLLGVGAMAAVFGFLAVRCRFWCALVWLLAIFCAAYVLQMGTLFYAEPFAAFCVLSGWERIRDGAGRVAGWVLIGLAGAFRPEGGVILAAVWLGVRLTRGRHAAPLAGLAAGAALPLAWICGCMACGVATPGLRPFFAPDGAQALVAFVRALKLVFLNPWLTGFAWWIALVGCFKAGGYPPSVRRRGIPACPPALLSALFCLVALAATFAWRVDVDFEWLLSSSLVRLLWVPSLLLVREILDGPRSV